MVDNYGSYVYEKEKFAGKAALRILYYKPMYLVLLSVFAFPVLIDGMRYTAAIHISVWDFADFE